MIFEDAAGLVKPERPGEPIVFRRVFDLSMFLQSLTGKPTALVQMPKPERAPEAFFVGIVLLADIHQPSDWAQDVRARVFTLERTIDSDGSTGLLCEWMEGGKHHNYGLQIAPDQNVFLQSIESILAKSKAPPTEAGGEAPPIQAKAQNAGSAQSQATSIRGDPELEQMLAKPEFLAEPVFRKDQYLAQTAGGLFGHYLRLTNQPPEVFKQIREAHVDASSICLMAKIFLSGKNIMIVAWTYDLDVFGERSIAGYAERARLPVIDVINPTTNQMKEHVLGRRVLRIQVEPDQHTPKSPPGAQIVRLKNIGWYVAALVPPMQKPPGS